MQDLLQTALIISTPPIALGKTCSSDRVLSWLQIMHCIQILSQR